MPPSPDPTVTPTLAARLRWALTERFGENHYRAADEGLESEVIEAILECVMAVLTPEPPTAPSGWPFGTLATAAQVRQYMESKPEPEPERLPPSVPAETCPDDCACKQKPGPPADDPRGLAVTFLDTDGLQHIADTMGEGPRALWLRELAARLATQITETLSLRQSLREAEQARDALRAALERIATMRAQTGPWALESVHVIVAAALMEAK